MRIHVLTIFPEFFASPLSVGVLKRAREAALLDVSLVDVREYTHDRHRSVDDTPYGGGSGMVMKPGPIVEALEATGMGDPRPHRVLLSPRGRLLDQRRVATLAALPEIAFVCGRYEGIDERVADFVDEEISIGDYVLAGGEPAAVVLMEAITRLIPGVLGNALSATTESFTTNLLEYPHYTRPESFRGRRVPSVLLSGDHGAIDRWRDDTARATTQRLRPDLLTREPVE